MVLTSYVEILKYAREHHFTVGAFNSYNLESLQALVSAANKRSVPLIVQTYYSHMLSAGADFMQAIADVASQKIDVKIALGLDHGKSFAQARQCIEAGYSGVMIDLASEDYDYNVSETKKVVALAHKHGVSVEAELGEIFDANLSLKEIATGYTDHKIAYRFVRETGIDCLAVSIGTAHGYYTHKPEINFDLLQELLKTIPCPIVVHGGSYTPDEDVLRMVRMGISKMNVGTEFFAAYKKSLSENLQHNYDKDVAEMMRDAREAVEAVAIKKIDLLTAYRK